MQTLEKSESAEERMGEVGTTVTLTNAADQVMALRGMLSQDSVHTKIK